MVLTHSQAKTFYDRFGRKQDAQAFYEDAALKDLISHADFHHATNVLEFGCGTGRFAQHLLTKHLPHSAAYLGIDISQTMIEIAEQHISSNLARAKVIQSDGSIRFPLPDQSVDRVVSTYVLDLLSKTDIHDIISEAGRVLTPGGKLCLVSLTTGTSFISRIVSKLWSIAFKVHAPLVGGCRPTQLVSYIDQNTWSVDYRNVVTQFGVPSEVLIASCKSTPNESGLPSSKNGATEL